MKIVMESGLQRVVCQVVLAMALTLVALTAVAASCRHDPCSFDSQRWIIERECGYEPPKGASSYAEWEACADRVMTICRQYDWDEEPDEPREPGDPMRGGGGW